jgi:hypothetical protein
MLNIKQKICEFGERRKLLACFVNKLNMLTVWRARLVQQVKMIWPYCIFFISLLCVQGVSPHMSLTKAAINNAADDEYVMLSMNNLVVAGYGSMLSSIFWVDFVFQYADVLIDGRQNRIFVPLFHLVADLDTQWCYPRLVAAWVLPDLPGHSTKDAVPFLIDGANRFPDQWKFRLTWAQYILEDVGIDSTAARDSASKILLPLSQSEGKIPNYVRELAFTILQKNGKPEKAMSILLQTYEQVPDPLIRFQFQNKITDLLRRNEVRLGASDSTAFFQAIGGMLESKDTSQIGMAKGLLVRLVRPEHKAGALAEAHQLAQQFKAYQQAAVGR